MPAAVLHPRPGAQHPGPGSARRNVAGAILRFGDKVLLEQARRRVFGRPACPIPEKTSLRDTSVTQNSEEAWRQGRLGPVYSVFEDPDQSTPILPICWQKSQVLGSGRRSSGRLSNATSCRRFPVRLRPIASMLTRFARETANQNFNLYLGDSVSGEDPHTERRSLIQWSFPCLPIWSG